MTGAPSRGARRANAVPWASSMLLMALAACDAGGTASIGREEAIATCAPACASTAGGCVVDYCASLPALAAAPSLDGVLECGLSLSPIDPAGWSGNEAKPADLAVAYAAAWRADGVYLFVEVHEAQRLPAPASAAVYCGDATHIFVDSDGAYAAPPAYDVPGTLQLVAAAPADASTPVARGETYAPTKTTAAWSTARFRTFPTPDGYVLEAFVTGEDLGVTPWSLGAGGHVGFDVSISFGGLPSMYGDPACPKRGDFVLRKTSASASTSGLPHDDTRAFCNPALGGPSP